MQNLLIAALVIVYAGVAVCWYVFLMSMKARVERLGIHGLSKTTVRVAHLAPFWPLLLPWAACSAAWKVLALKRRKSEEAK